MTRRLGVRLLLIVLVALLPTLALAWGTHPQITRAALDVVPDAAHWKQLLGEANWNSLVDRAWLPDQRDQDLGSFYADDYLLIRGLPTHVGHGMPEVQRTYEPYFRRALQALRTETAANAVRQMGPLLHFVEDPGAPPHVRPGVPHHSELENWQTKDPLTIAGYEPQLLGRTDDEALAGLLKRMEGLVAYSTERVDRALPLASAENPDRAQIEPILFESARECARVTADVLCTVLALGMQDQAPGAGLAGTVTAAEFPLLNDHGARIVLLDTDYCTLAITAASAASPEGWRGSYEFRHLPAGTYRVLAYRTASQWVVSEPVTLTTGETTRLDLALPPTDPPGNIIENPDGTLSYLQPGVPDRWRVSGNAPKRTWSSMPARLTKGHEFRCGALLKDPAATVRFRFTDVPDTPERALPAGELAPAEFTVTSGEKPGAVTVVVESEKPLTEAIERVWVVPVGEGQ